MILKLFTSQHKSKAQCATQFSTNMTEISTVEEYKQILTPYLTKWYVVTTLLVVLWYAISAYNTSRIKKRLGCEQPKRYLKSSLSFIWFARIMLRYKKEGRLPEFVGNVFKEVGADTFWIKIFYLPVFCTTNHENIKALLATQFNDFALGYRHAHFKPMLGDGIFTLDGEGWKNSRAMLRPQFVREQIAHTQSLEQHLQIFAKHIEASRGSTINIQDLFFKFTVDTATEFLFGESVNSLSDESIGLAPPNDFDGRAGFADAFNLSQSYLASRSYVQILYFLVDNKEFRGSIKRVHKFADYYVRKALSYNDEELEKVSSNGYTFLYELVKQTRNRKILQDQLLNILVAGRDTTAGLLSFTFFELARNPEVFEKLKSEVYRHFGDSENPRLNDITFESMKKCEYLKWVLNEILRLYPSVPQNFRVATKNTTLPRGGGADGQSPMYIPKGSTIAYSVYFTHRNPEIYGKDAEEFRPERWATLKNLGWAYLPFNGGPRICLGQQFALTEASYVVIRLLQMFPHLESRDDTYPPKVSFQLTMCHQDGVFVSLRK